MTRYTFIIRHAYFINVNRNLIKLILLDSFKCKDVNNQKLFSKKIIRTNNNKLRKNNSNGNQKYYGIELSRN